LRIERQPANPTLPRKWTLKGVRVFDGVSRNHLLVKMKSHNVTAIA